jgi:hypothetical protein
VSLQYRFGHLLSASGVLLLVVSLALAHRIGYGFFILFFLAAFPVALAGSICIAVERGAGWKRLTPLAYLLGLAAAFWLAPRLQDPVERGYLHFRGNALEAFVIDIRSYGKISGMSDANRFYKEFNLDLITFNPSDVDTQGIGRDVVLLDTALERSKVSRAKYEDFRRRLIDLGFINFTTQGEILIFTRDGMLDNCYGLAYSESKRIPKSTSCGSVVRWDHLTGNWYSFGTS